MKSIPTINKVRDEIVDELFNASLSHQNMHSLHEAYSIILEEVDELWDQVKLKPSKRDNANIKTELIQIAAMAMRAILDLNLSEE